MRLLAVVSFLALCSLACAAPGAEKDADDGGGGPFGGGGGGGEDDTGDEAPSYTWESVVIDFDELDREIDVSEEYAQWVTFETAERDYALYSWDYASYARSEPMSAYTTSGPSGAGVTVDLTFVFAAPVRGLAFYTLGDQTDGRFAKVDVELEDGSTDTVNLVGDGSSSTGERADLTDYEDVVSITIYDIEDAYSVNFDDITFELRREE